MQTTQSNPTTPTGSRSRQRKPDSTARTKTTATQKTAADRSRRLRIQMWESIILIVIGCALLIAGFLTPPTGEIHSSVLIAFGEILTFVGAIFGLDYHYKAIINEHLK